MGSSTDDYAAKSLRLYQAGLSAKQSDKAQTSAIERFMVADEAFEAQKELEKDGWRKYYLPWNPSDTNNDPVTERLRTEAKNLSRLWLNFRDELPVEQRDNIDGQTPSVEGLVSMVTRYTNAKEEAKAQRKRGKFMKNFTSICTTVQSHEYMLDILPSGSEYVSIFTGTLKTIVTACSNYDRISQGFAKAFTIIGEHIEVCRKRVVLFNTQNMLCLLAELYSHIFLFLADVMKWYLKKSRHRFLDAFKGDFYDEFKDRIDIIVGISSRIQGEANLGSQAEVRTIRLSVENSQEQTSKFFSEFADQRIGLDGLARQSAEMKQMMKYLLQETERDQDARRKSKDDQIMLMREILAQVLATENTKGLLTSRAEDYYQERAVQPIPIIGTSISYNRPARPTQMIDPRGMHTYTRDDLEFFSRNLEDFTNTTKIKPDFDTSQPISLTNSIASYVEDWSQSSESSILSLAGYRTTWPEISQATKLAAVSIYAAEHARLPVISYFCELFPGEKIRQGNTRDSQELIALVSSLIRQLIAFLPPILETDRDLDQEVFARVDGTLDAWNALLVIFRDLLYLGPPRLYCIIDGFQWLDGRATNGALRELVSVLRGKDIPDTNSLKVLITTQGRSRALEQELNRSEMLYADQERAGSGAARRRGGAPFTASLT